ncbi:MAG: Tetratricopeptide 2 repeat protein [Bryobacterales bacterium]|nr:Tetratricopeptide 2 repeat protein [Bryobacterales bacterium]
MRQRWWLAAIVFCLALGGAIYFVRGRSSATPKLAEARYVDPTTCAGCHPAISETYQRTGMGRAFYRPTLSNTIGKGDKPPTFYHKASDSYFTMLERDGHFYQRRHQIGFDGKETNVLEKEIDYVVGSGNHVRAYLNRTSRNTLVELPLAWYSEKGGYWAMNPAYDRPDHPGFRRTITNGCIFCHNGYPDAPSVSGESAAEPVFPEHLPEGIDCQRCHGPGSKHVEMAEAGGAAIEDVRKAIVNPSRLNPERQMEVCMQCHLETTSFHLPNAIVRYERGPFSYRPGEPLGDFMLQFDQSPGNEKFEIASAAYRLRRSACFLKSEGALRCTTCHNPHDIPRGEEAVQHYTQVCRQCHSTALNDLVASGKHSQSGDCIGCHMPKRRTDDVVHVVMTDHYIQRQKPAADLLAPIAERPETDENGYHGEVKLYYPQQLPKSPENELYLAIAQVAQKSNLGEGAKQLAAAIEKHHPDRIEYYLHLGDAWTDGGQPEKGLPLYEEAVRRQPNSLLALQKLGSSLSCAGQLARATETLQRALKVAPTDAPTWHQLGLNYLAQGSRSEAASAFEKAVNLDPDLPEAYNSLGGVRLESGDLSRAEPAFREAIRIQPDYAEAHSNLGNVLSSSGRFEEARYHFETALRLKPGYSAGRYNYAIALARIKRFNEAQRQIEQLLRADPAAAEAHDLLGNLMAMKGNVKAALDQYREAVRIRPGFGRGNLDLGAMLADLGDGPGALPYLQRAAASPEQAVREEAAQILRQLGKNR